ncbi:MAG: twin-arginine translocation signal domain-containing protein [Candidatus Korobacteraceae bacterium]
MKDPQGSSEGTLPVGDQDTQRNEEKRRKHTGANTPGTSRRTFLGQVGVGGAAAVALAAIPFEPLIEGKHAEAEAAVVQYGSGRRARDSYDYRQDTARNERD